MRIAAILADKGGRVVTVTPETSVATLVHRLARLAR